MVLLDALYINNSGGFQLLKYLVDTLVEREIVFFLLADSRCKGRLQETDHQVYMKASLLNRKKFYVNNKDRFSSILCFGNIPSPIKMRIPVYTYFHNINILTVKDMYTRKKRIKTWLKREIIRYYKGNTDYWIVQTPNTQKALIKHLKETDNKVKLMPFFFIPNDLLKMAGKSHGSDYVYIANYTGAKGHEILLEAWCELHALGIDKNLHLTIPERETAFIEKIKSAQRKGVKVINHGFIPFEDVIDLYHASKAIVYPSLNESLGLGLIEAIASGCDVIASDLPFVYDVCEPSEVFNPTSVDGIVNAIIEYEKGESPKSCLRINNEMDALINLLSPNKSN